MSIEAPILVTGAAGRTGGVGGEIVDILRGRGLPVRALVRTDDDRAGALRATGAEVVEPFDRRQRELDGRDLPEHLRGHLLTMAKLHADDRYDRLTHDVEEVIGRPATSVRDYVEKHPRLFGPVRTASPTGSR